MTNSRPKQDHLDTDTGLPLADLAPGPPPPRKGSVTRLPAGQTLLMAARVEAEAARLDPAEATVGRQLAREVVEQVRSPIEHEPAIGGELVPAGDTPAALVLRDILERPDAVAADASRVRLELADRAGVLETALDAADTMEASNSFEKMLAHQLAASHRGIMRLAGQFERRMDRLAQANLSYAESDRMNVEACRLINTMGRMMTTYQAGLATFQRLRTGGSQQVVVQHQYVTKVEDGGQAIVAGKLKAGGQRRKRKGKRGSGARNER